MRRHRLIAIGALTILGMLATAGVVLAHAGGVSSFVGGGDNTHAHGDFSAVVGGQDNTAFGAYDTISGGSRNRTRKVDSTVGGGIQNKALGARATVGGGTQNKALGELAAVGGGFRNTASGTESTIGGGRINNASASHTAIAGGFLNTASGIESTIGGGSRNVASARNATVGGGRENHASAQDATVAGGAENEASALAATVAGGDSNIATGRFSFIAGSTGNIASGPHSFVLGHHGTAAHTGAFLFSDSDGTGGNVRFSTIVDGEFAVRARGGVRFVMGIDAAGKPTTECNISGGSGTFSCISDRNAKANFSSVDGQDILERLTEVPIEIWNYKSQDPSVRHIGPMAQDFYAAFGVGEDDRHISIVDSDGVALAAIQGLYQIIQEQDSQIAALEERLVKLEEAAGASGTPATGCSLAGC